MALYVIVAMITVLVGLLVNSREEKYEGVITRGQLCNGLGLFTIFLILFALSALRLNVGNDYAKYVEFMHLIHCDAYVPTEAGFNSVVRLLYKISGYENYLLVFGFFAFFTVLLFLAAIYRQADSFGFSFFLFMAFGYYFQSFSTVRYYLALAVALCAIPYVLRKEWLKFILLILLGAAFHKSLLVVLPLYLLASHAWKKWQLVLAAAFCSTFFFLQDFYLKAVVFLYPTYEETEYLEGGTSPVNIVRCAGVLILSLLLYKKAVADNRRNRFYFYCNLGALVMYVCCSFLPVISRIGYYLTITHIFFLPVLVKSVENPKLRKLLTAGIAAAGILYFAMLMYRAAGEGLRILPYQTFLFHDMVPILSDVN
jgi:hypothetical protein